MSVEIKTFCKKHDFKATVLVIILLIYTILFKLDRPSSMKLT